MWTLVPGDPAGAPQFWLLCAKSYLLGRKDVDLVLPEDRSISRTHAYLTVAPMPRAQAKDLGYRPKVTLQDKSRFGTFVNEEKMNAGEERELMEGDVLHFGDLRKNIRYTVAWLPLVFCTSSLLKEHAREAQDLLLQLGANLADTPDGGCTHLLASEVRAVAKVMLALALGLPIVGVPWLAAATQRSDCTRPLPEPALFLPPIHADWAAFGTVPPEAFQVNALRQTLFSRITFLFRDKAKLDAHAPLIHAAKGIAVWDDSPALAAFPIQYPNTVVVRTDEADLDPAYGPLEQMGFPVVPSFAVQLAILHANADPIRPRPTNPFSQRPVPSPSRPPPPAPPHPAALPHCGTAVSQASAVPSAGAQSTVTSITGPVSTDRAGSTPRLGLEPDGGTPPLPAAAPAAAAAEEHRATGFAASHQTPKCEPVPGWMNGYSLGNLVQEVLVPLVAVDGRRTEALPYFKWRLSAQPGRKCFRKQQLPPRTASVVAVVDANDFYTTEKLSLLPPPVQEAEDDVEFMAHDHLRPVPCGGSAPNDSPFPARLRIHHRRRPASAATTAPKAKRPRPNAPPARPSALALAHRRPLATALAPRHTAPPVSLQQPPEAGEEDELGAFARHRETPAPAHDTFDFNED